jgi:cell division protein FtsI/penicillin-binding protein 2
MWNFLLIKKYAYLTVEKIRENIPNILKIIFIFCTTVAVIRILTINIMVKKLIWGKKFNGKKRKINLNNKNTLIYDRNGESLTTIKKTHFLVLDVLRYKSLEPNEKQEVFNLLKNWNKSMREKHFELFEEKIAIIKANFLDFALEQKEKNLRKAEEEINLHGYKAISITYKRNRSFCYKNSFCHILGSGGEAGDKMQSVISFLNKNKEDIKSIQLSIDARIQESVSQCLNHFVNYYNADGSWLIGIELDSREIITLTSNPDFDPSEESMNLLFKHSNKILTARYEVGSIMKIISSAFYMSQESGLNLAPESIIHVPREYKIGSYVIKDELDVGDRPDLTTIFVKSSNKGFATIMQNVTVNQYMNFLEKSGFYQPIKVDKIFFEKSRKKVIWPKYRILSFSYGYGVSMSPIQIAFLFANVFQGEKKDLTLIKNIKFTDSHRKYSAKQTESPRIFHPKIRKNLVFMLNKLGQNNARLYQLGVIAKTGTKLILSGKQYDRSRILAFLVAFYPKENPKYMFILCVENPRNLNTFSNVVTRPMMIKIMEHIKPYLDERN